MTTQQLECLEADETCAGAVEYRWPGYGVKSWPRCEKHGEERIAREEQTQERYPYHQPADFDPLDAGESWEEI